MKKRVLALLLALVLVVGLLAACGGSGNSSQGGNNSTPVGDAGNDGGNAGNDGGDEGSEPSNVSAGPDDTTEHYEFTTYWKWAWAPTKEWGADALSAWLGEHFNVTVNNTKPDSDEDSKFTLLLNGGEWPDCIILDRNGLLPRLITAGGAIPLTPFQYEGNPLNEGFSDSALAFMSNEVNGVTEMYGIPTWGRQGGSTYCTGGNYQWQVNTRLYEEIGAPDLNSLNDLHDAAVAAKEAGLQSYNGQSVYPIYFYPNNASYTVWWPIYRALGGAQTIDTYFTQDWDEEAGKSLIKFGLDNEKYVEALRIANQWYNEGLWSADSITDDGDTALAKMTGGRAAFLWYDFSQDNTNNYRRILRESTGNAESYEVVGDPDADELYAGTPIAKLSDFPYFMPADGVTVTYGDENGTAGWCMNAITPAATRPQRIFDVYCYMITWDGSILLQYGPEGGLWEGKDENNAPIFKKPLTEISSSELDAAGAWLWTYPAHSDYVDTIKFAVADQSPLEEQDFTSRLQGHMTSLLDPDHPTVGQKFATDENANVTDAFTNESELGVCRQSIRDNCSELLTQVIMASDESTFNSLIDQMKQNAANNRVDEICAEYQAVKDHNTEIQGWSAYDPAFDLYRLG